MIKLVTRVLGPLACGLLLAASTASAQAPLQDAAPSVGSGSQVPRDCSRWPASVFNEESQSCACPAGMWWNLRGDACLPREHAAAEFCSTVWPSSSPYLIAGVGYRCVCAPPLLWDAQATGCRQPVQIGESECTAEWPGTLPVLSPSGTEFECRCPGGQRWDEGVRSCVAGAPVVPVSRGFYGEEGAAGPGLAPGAPPPAGAGGWPATAPTNPATADPAAASPPVPVVPIPPVPAAAGGRCEALLSEIRGRAQAGQTAEADALGMKAAVAGCDPAAISEAARAAAAP